MNEELITAIKDAHIQIDSSTAEKIAEQYILLKYVENFSILFFCISIILLIGWLIHRVTRANRLQEDAKKWRDHEYEEGCKRR
jgi:flagellar biogenesis protein FliO